MSGIKEVLNSAESAIALGEKEYALKILERYESIRRKFAGHGVFDKESWKEFDERYRLLLEKIGSP